MPRKKTLGQEVEEALEEDRVISGDLVGEVEVNSEKERLLALYQTLKDLNIRSISDLENLIARS